jgi:putative resolvase
MYRISIAAALLGVSVPTIRRWDQRGWITCERTAGGHRRVPAAEVARLRGDTAPARGDERRVVAYARVSSHQQKVQGDLERQANRMMQAAGPDALCICDTGSGLNCRRPGLRRLIALVTRGWVREVVVAQRDRLTRFGFPFLEHFFRHFGCAIRVVERAAELSPMEELVDDVMSLMASFSGKLYKARALARRAGAAAG